MPLYEYRCDACHRRFEVIRKFTDPELDACTLCGKGPVHRLLSSPAIQFKGSGWYITDYSKKGKTEGESAGAPGSESKPAPADTASGTKTETGGTKTETTTPAAKPAVSEK
jgi:putative FmdB family regulatory protein